MTWDKALFVCALTREAGWLSSVIPAESSRVLGPGNFFNSGLERCLNSIKPRQCVLLAGFSGALRRDLKPGDIVLADAVSSNEGTIFANLKDRFTPPPGCRIGSVHMTQGLVESAAKKQQLGLQTGALAVDMESAFFARSCQKLGIPWLIVRVIFDRMVDPLHPRMMDWCRGDGSLNGWRMARDMALSPDWWWRTPGWGWRERKAGLALANLIGHIHPT